MRIAYESVILKPPEIIGTSFKEISLFIGKKMEERCGPRVDAADLAFGFELLITNLDAGTGTL